MVCFLFALEPFRSLLAFLPAKKSIPSDTPANLLPFFIIFPAAENSIEKHQAE